MIELVDENTIVQCVFLVCVYVKEGPVNSERYLSWASGFLVVYSIDKMESFEGCQLYLQTLALHNKTFKPHTPILLLGNKLDLDRYRLVSVCDQDNNITAITTLLTLLSLRNCAVLSFVL